MEKDVVVIAAHDTCVRLYKAANEVLEVYKWVVAKSGTMFYDYKAYKFWL